MIKQALNELAKRIFWLFTVALVLGLPLMLFAAPYMEANGRFDGPVATPTGWLALGGLAAFGLVIVGIIVFYIFPTLLELGEAIWEARKNSKDEMFP